MDKEICICSAILMPDGYIIRGHRHDSCFWVANRMPRYKDDVSHDDVVQGFVTSKNRFVGRREALILQMTAGIASAAPGGYRGDELFSEDMY